MNEKMKKIFTEAIRNFITIDEVLSDDFIRRAAEDYVYEHDEEIREHLRDEINMDDEFESILDSLDWYDIW